MMAKRQSRRTISVTGRNYRRLRVYAAEHGISMARIIDDHLEALLVGIEDPDPGFARERRKKAAEQERKRAEARKAFENSSAVMVF